MRLASAAYALLLAALATYACGEATGADPEPEADAGARIDSGLGTPTEEDASETPPDNGEVHKAPDGCILKSTGMHSGRKVEALPRSDLPSAVAWTNVVNAQQIDGKFASVTLGDGQESAELRLSDFALDVPTNADTWGIEVELKRQAPQGGIEDVRVDVFVEGQATGYKVLKGPWPKSIVGTHVYGQAVDTWHVNLNPPDVNKPIFAALLWVRKAADAGVAGPVTALVESIRVNIWYCPH
jgi:hypothetical protein